MSFTTSTVKHLFCAKIKCARKFSVLQYNNFIVQGTQYIKMRSRLMGLAGCNRIHMQIGLWHFFFMFSMNER